MTSNDDNDPPPTFGMWGLVLFIIGFGTTFAMMTADTNGWGDIGTNMLGFFLSLGILVVTPFFPLISFCRNERPWQYAAITLILEGLAIWLLVSQLN
jgi:hypothetical protein